MTHRVERYVNDAAEQHVQTPLNGLQVEDLVLAVDEKVREVGRVACAMHRRRQLLRGDGAKDEAHDQVRQPVRPRRRVPWWPEWWAVARAESYADDTQALVATRSAVTLVPAVTFAPLSGQVLHLAKSSAFTMF